MKEILLSILIPALPGLVALALLGLGRLAKKTKTPVDDKIVEYVRAHAPQVVKAIEDRLRPKASSEPREKVRDHRDGPGFKV